MKALYRSKRITSQTSGKFLLARFLLPRCTASRDVACPYHGCSKPFRTAQDLLVHTSREHNVQPRPSPHGCEPEKLYTEAGAYYKHVEGTHSGRWPRPVKFPIVRGEKEFKRALHTTIIYSLSMGSTLRINEDHICLFCIMYKPYEPTNCPFHGCTDQRIFRTIRDLRRHLVSRKHGRR